MARSGRPRTLMERFGENFLKEVALDIPVCNHCGCKIYVGCGLSDPLKCKHQDKITNSKGLADE